MRVQRAIPYLLLLVAISSSVPVLHGEITLKSINEVPTTSIEAIRKDLEKTNEELRTGTTFSGDAQTTLEGLGRFLKDSLGLDRLTSKRHITLAEGRSDVIVGEWDSGKGSQNYTLFVRDTPYITYIYIALPARSMRTRTEITETLKSLFVWSAAPLWLRKIDLFLFERDSVEYVSGRLPTPRSESGFTQDLSLAGCPAGTQFILRVRLGKRLLADYVPHPLFVAERFPPLSRRLVSWGYSQILGDLGWSGPNESGMDATYRDTELLAEILRRDPSPAELLRLIIDVPAHQVGRRMILLSGASTQAGKPIPDAVLRDIIRHVNSLGQHGERAAHTALLDLSDSCSEENGSFVIDYLRNGISVRGARKYLEDCGPVEAGIEALSDPTVRSRDPMGVDITKKTLERRLERK